MQVERRREPLDEVQAMLRDSVQAFVARHPGAKRLRALRDGRATEADAVWPSIAESGWLSIMTPESLGGLGLGLAELCAVAEELAAGLAPETFVADNLAIAVLTGGDNADLTVERLPALLDGSSRLALAWQEAANTLDPREVATTATPVAGGVALNGAKRMIPGAATASAFLVTAEGPSGLGAYWVDPAQPGVSLDLRTTVDGVALGDLTLNDVVVADDRRISGEASSLLTRVLEEARMAASAALFGLVRQALAITVDYTRTRQQFGKPIGSFQSLQHRMVDLWMQQEITRNTLAHALVVFAATEDPAARAVAASAAKAQASKAAMLVTRQAIQLHGGVGYADEYDIGLFLKRAIVLSGWLGTASLHRRRYVLEAPGFDDQA
ncbi:acyl-CoA dehydrogenase [Phenylobacterium sp.]|uniref:acyl-CoA dehydrogenase family protein n=1 Tax=Phenylobacterium sp. TaxID=1871053 RepID=UPI0025E0AD84|nr:acyl-CoA dehydrogenase [Phenylobacterium sp.]